MPDLPEKIGKYPVVGTAGHGNMGIVYIGYDPFHNRDVAILEKTSDELTNHGAREDNGVGDTGQLCVDTSAPQVRLS